MEVSACVTSHRFCSTEFHKFSAQNAVDVVVCMCEYFSTSTCTRIRTYSYDRGGLFTDVICDNIIIGLRSEISLFDVVLS